jgi:hypothetical protein
MPRKQRKVAPAQELMPVSNRAKAKSLIATMQETHPIYGVFARVFEELGGQDRLLDWADDNFTDFIRIFSKMVPSGPANSGVSQINIQINNELGPSPLDQ